MHGDNAKGPWKIARGRTGVWLLFCAPTHGRSGIGRYINVTIDIFVFSNCLASLFLGKQINCLDAKARGSIMMALPTIVQPASIMASE